MTIGPEPMTRMDLMSLRLGTGHDLTELVEQVGGVVGTGGGLGVVLHAEGPAVEQPQALDALVVEVDVADLGPAVGGVERRVEGGLDREAVVVRGDLDLTGAQVLDRLVHAAVAVAELVGRQAERAAEELVAEADAEERRAALEHLAQGGDVGGGRVAGAVGEEDAIR